ncbi:MAG TPA: hypothetical protein VHE83_14975 [Mycobacteriales bacterium]|nr:hypothetical protein [Mycobacteriales bacterium]
MLWVLFAWVVAVGLVVILVLTAGLGVWRSVKTLTGALGQLGEHAAAAAEELSAVTSAVGPGDEPGDRADTVRSRREPARGAGRTMQVRRRPPVGRGR